jgi:hypothetical protein
MYYLTHLGKNPISSINPGKEYSSRVVSRRYNLALVRVSDMPTNYFFDCNFVCGENEAREVGFLSGNLSERFVLGF